jgi:hypothetical protein
MTGWGGHSDCELTAWPPVATNGPIAIEAHAQGDDGAVQRVEFRAGGSLLGTDANTP